MLKGRSPIRSKRRPSYPREGGIVSPVPRSPSFPASIPHTRSCSLPPTSPGTPIRNVPYPMRSISPTRTPLRRSPSPPSSPCLHLHPRSQYGDCPVEAAEIEWRTSLRGPDLAPKDDSYPLPEQRRGRDGAECRNCPVLREQLSSALKDAARLRERLDQERQRKQAKAAVASVGVQVDELGPELQQRLAEIERAESHLRQREVEWADEWAAREAALVQEHQKKMQQALTCQKGLETHLASIKELQNRLKESAMRERAVEERMVALESEVTRHKAEAERLRELLSATTSALEDERSKNAQSGESYVGQLQQAQSRAKEAESELARVQGELRIVMEALDKEKEASARAREALQQGENSLGSKVVELEQRLRGANEEITRLRKEAEGVHAAKLQLSALEEERKRVEEERRRMEDAMAQSHHDAKQAIEELRKLQTQRESELRGEAERVNSTLAEVQQQLEVAEAKAERLERKMADMQADHETQLARTTATLEQFRAASVAERAVLQERITQAKGVADEALASSNRFEAEASRLALELQAAREEASQAEGARARLLEQLDAERKALQSSIEAATRAARDSSSEADAAAASLSQQLAQANATNASLLEELENARRDCTREALRLQEALRERDEARSAQSSIVDGLRAQIEKLQEGQLELSREASEKQMELDRMMADKEAVHQELQQKNRQLEGVQGQHAKERESWTRMRENIEAALRKAQAELTDLRIELEDVKGEKEETSSQLARLRVEVEKQDQEQQRKIQTLREKLSASEERGRQAAVEMMELKGKIEEAEDALLEEEKRCKSKDGEIKALEDRIARLKASNERVYGLQDKIDALQSQNQEMDHQLEGAQSSAKEAEREADRLRGRLEEEQGIVSTLKATVAQLKEQLAAERAKQREAEERVRAQEDMIRDELAQAAVTLRQRTDALKGLEGRLQDSEKRCASLKQELSEARAATIVLEEKLGEKEKEVSRLRGETDELRGEAKGVEEARAREVAALKGQAETMRERAREAEEQLQATKSDLEGATRRLKALEAEKKETERRIEELATEKAALSQSASPRKEDTDKIRQLEDRIEELLEQMREAESLVSATACEREELEGKIAGIMAREDEELSKRMQSMQSEYKKRIQEHEEEAKAKIKALRRREEEVEDMQAEVLRQKEEVEFVIFTRAELVQEIMDLRKCIQGSKAELGRRFTKDPTYRKAVAAAGGHGVLKLPTRFMTEALDKMKDQIDLSKDRIDYIVGRYLTTYEKMHHGSSPQHFGETHDDSFLLFDRIMRTGSGRRSSSPVGRRRDSSSPTGSPRHAQRVPSGGDAVGVTRAATMPHMQPLLALQHPKEPGSPNSAIPSNTPGSRQTSPRSRAPEGPGFEDFNASVELPLHCAEEAPAKLENAITSKLHLRRQKLQLKQRVDEGVPKGRTLSREGSKHTRGGSKADEERGSLSGSRKQADFGRRRSTSEGAQRPPKKPQPAVSDPTLACSTKEAVSVGSTPSSAPLEVSSSFEGTLRDTSQAPVQSRGGQRQPGTTRPQPAARQPQQTSVEERRSTGLITPNRPKPSQQQEVTRGKEPGRSGKGLTFIDSSKMPK
eukprot:Sspe_Gene.8365::Locus_2855_Transcript_1_6_Confidence_0.250_Length_4866::g.8365::m.8365